MSGRGLHSFNFQLHVRSFCGKGGALRGALGGVRGCLGVCRVCVCLTHGLG